MGKFKEIIEILSKVSTIGIFMLALFGYFYTVKPKFELDNLKLSMVNVKKEKEKIESQVKAFIEDFDKLKSEKDSLTKSLSFLSLEKKDLILNLNILNDNYKKDVNELNNKLNSYDNTILKKENYISLLDEKIKNSNLNLFMIYLFNGIDTINRENNKYTTFTFSFNETDNSSKKDKKYELLKITNDDKFLLDKYAPYNELVNKINNFEYLNNMIFSKNEFNIIKELVLKTLYKNKNNLTYNNRVINDFILNLNKERKKTINLLNNLESDLVLLNNKDLSSFDEKVKNAEKINELNYERNTLSNELYNNLIKYHEFIRNEKETINNIIDDFVKKSIL